MSKLLPDCMPIPATAASPEMVNSVLETLPKGEVDLLLVVENLDSTERFANAYKEAAKNWEIGVAHGTYQKYIVDAMRKEGYAIAKVIEVPAPAEARGKKQYIICKNVEQDDIDMVMFVENLDSVEKFNSAYKAAVERWEADVDGSKYINVYGSYQEFIFDAMRQEGYNVKVVENWDVVTA